MSNITIFTKETSPRLLYTLDWIFKEILSINYTLVHTEDEIKTLPFFIAYGSTHENALTIPDTGLLWSQKIEEQNITTGNWQDLPCIFYEGYQYNIPFDLFSAVFFLISRYEEYYPFPADKHERYPYTESILYKINHLSRPLVDDWIATLRSVLISRFDLDVPDGSYRFIPTYDIDIAYSYKYKSPGRTAGSLLKSLLSGNLQELSNRLKVLNNKIPDPFDCFNWLYHLHTSENLNPIYFILAAPKPTAFDRNNDPMHPAMQQLVRSLKNDGEIGMHPSYFSIQNNTFNEEKEILENAINRPITKSRQHYIRLKIPETYQLLIDNNFTDDYSMGYPAKLGFRAGTSFSFNWYDLKNNRATNLKIHPFPFMDSTARFEERINVEEAFRILKEINKSIKLKNGQMISVFHNFSLGTDNSWAGWPENYERFLKSISSGKL